MSLNFGASHFTGSARSEFGMQTRRVELMLVRLVGKPLAMRFAQTALRRLHNAERKSMARMAPSRREEFSSGRYCAHAALGRLGAPFQAVPRSADRTPAWPAGFVGSITHSDGLCWAAAGVQSDWLSLGVDAERMAALPAALHAHVASSEEVEACRALGLTPTLLFSAKEAAYKCLYPLSGLFLDFTDIAIRLRPQSARCGRFDIRLRNAAKPGAKSIRAIRGAWLCENGYIFTLAVLAASAAGPAPSGRRLSARKKRPADRFRS